MSLSTAPVEIIKESYERKKDGEKAMEPDHVCDLCHDPLKATEETLHCEGSCGKHLHRYCAGVSKYHYLELKNSSSPFVSRICKIDGELRVKRKNKDNPLINRTKWWFVIHAKEKLLSDLDAKWEPVKLQTLWKLEPCFRHESAPTEAGETRTDSIPPPADLETAQNISLVTTSSDTADSQQQPVPGSDLLCAFTTNYV